MQLRSPRAARPPVLTKLPDGGGERFPVPDLLHLEPRLDLDYRQLHELLGLAFTGRSEGHLIDQALAGPAAKAAAGEDFFSRDLFVEPWARDGLSLTLDGRRYGTNHAFLHRTLIALPQDLGTVEMRQQILAELDADPELLRRAGRLYQRLHQLIHMFKVPGRMAELDVNAFRMELFGLAKEILDTLVDDFGEARSQLRRLHQVGLEIRQTEAYELLAALLDYSQHRAMLNVDLRVGASGKITGLELRRVDYNRHNRFFQGPWRRWGQKLLALVLHGFRISDTEIIHRLVQAVYDRIAFPLMGLGQLLGHLEVYLTQHQLRQRAARQGLAMCLPEVALDGPLELQDLFNPLLLSHHRPPVPCSLSSPDARSVTVVTGPNSGGKTRLLQALGLAQLLGQGGFYVPASRARLVCVHSLFVSLVEHEAVEHSEGRLGRELERIRAMFEAMQEPSMVLVDELCSGTNPSEGIEVFSLVLRLLEQVRPVAFITTHFLDYARELELQPPIGDLRFLHAQVVDQRPTYQFLPGGATTSLATQVAERMGVTFEHISALILQRRAAHSPHGT